MRPLTRARWHGGLAGALLVDVVFQQLGRFCAACERRLTSGTVLWHAPSGRLVGGRAHAEVWEGTFALCAECAAAAEGRPATEHILLPDRDATFRLGPTSPLRYERRDTRSPGETGAPTSAVVAIGATERARATIRHFDLNTAYYDDATGRFDLPGGELLGALDPRLELRTRTWDLAASFVPMLRSDDPAVRAAGRMQVRAMLYHAGFWSVWATVLWTELGAVDDIVGLLAPGTAPPAGLTALGGAPARPAVTDFPGTRSDWLPGPSDDAERGG